MLNSSELQIQYNKLYIKLREYLWGIRQVECIANLEIEIYKQFPNLDSVLNAITKLKNLMHITLLEDEDLRNEINKLEDIAKSDKDIYIDLKICQEVNPL